MTDLQFLEISYAENTFVITNITSPDTTIKTLRLDRNNMVEITECLENLHALEFLSLEGNRLTELPEISNPLKHLNLMYNQTMKSIPESLIHIQTLEELNLFGTLVDTIPESLNEMPNLQKIYIHTRSGDLAYDKSIWTEHKNGYLERV